MLPAISVITESPSPPELSVHLAIWFRLPLPEARGCTESAESAAIVFDAVLSPLASFGLSNQEALSANCAGHIHFRFRF